MQELNTRTVVKQFATNCMDWLNKDLKLRTMNIGGNGLSLTLSAFRSYLDKFLSNMVEFRVSTDWELDLGHYHISCSADKNYAVVKRSKRRIPRTSAKYIEWGATFGNKWHTRRGTPWGFQWARRLCK